MSVSYDGRAGDFGGDNRYLMMIDEGSKTRRPLGLVWWLGAAAVCLVLLLLTVIMVAHNTSAINSWDAKYENLINNLTKDTSALSYQLKQQKMSPSSLSQDKGTQGQEDAVKSEREALTEEREALKNERHQLQNYSTDLIKERNALRTERDQQRIYISNLTQERDALRDERKALKDERAVLKGEREQLKTYSNNLTEFKDALEKEREALRNEQGALNNERGALKNERSHLSILTFNLTKERDALRDEEGALKDEASTLRRERDILKEKNRNLTKEKEALQAQYEVVSVKSERLQRELNILNPNTTDNVCFDGWVQFNGKCYYYSSDGAAETWEKSKKDCQSRGGYLAMPKTRDELKFVSKGNSYTWIGLSDKAEEGTWRWLDGTLLEDWGFWKDGEPNNSGNEDCVEVARDEIKINDAPCTRKFSWVCEV